MFAGVIGRVTSRKQKPFESVTYHMLKNILITGDLGRYLKSARKLDRCRFLRAARRPSGTY
jgi:hypothetical protein